MNFPNKLKKDILEFLKSLPDIQDSDTQKALISETGLDQELENQVVFGQSTSQFVASLVQTLIKYGTLKDGREAIEAVLETAKGRVGHDRKAHCERLIRAIQVNKDNYLAIPEEENRIKTRSGIIAPMVIGAIIIIVLYVGSNYEQKIKGLENTITNQKAQIEQCNVKKSELENTITDQKAQINKCYTAINDYEQKIKTLENPSGGTIPLLKAGYDFITNYRDAEWTSGVVSDKTEEYVLIPDGKNEPKGSVTLLRDIDLEGEQKCVSCLRTHPKWEQGGFIQGKYGPFKIQSDLKIQCQVGFVVGGVNGTPKVEFRIKFLKILENGLTEEVPKRLDELSVTYDPSKELDTFTVDLNKIKDSEGYIILYVEALSELGYYWAVWNSAKVIS